RELRPERNRQRRQPPRLEPTQEVGQTPAEPGAQAEQDRRPHEGWMLLGQPRRSRPPRPLVSVLGADDASTDGVEATSTRASGRPRQALRSRGRRTRRSGPRVGRLAAPAQRLPQPAAPRVIVRLEKPRPRRTRPMPFKVVATPFRRGAPATYQYERESLDPIGAEITVVQADTDDARLAQARDADAVIVGGRRLTGDLIRGREKCKVFASGAVGVDTIDVDAATEKGIVVCNCPDVFIEEVAVHAMMLILGLAKKVVPLDRAVREGRWGEARQYMKPMPRVVGDTLGLVAFGNIARLVARKAKGFDMHVLAWDPFVPDEVFAQHGVERVADLKDVFRRSDYVSAHLPLNPQTRGLLTYEYFSVMKPTAYFVNTGRGQTQVDADLIRAMNEGK